MPIPIIGQPDVTDYFVTIQLKCPCGAVFMLIGRPGSGRACPNELCTKAYMLMRWANADANGNPEWPIGVGKK